MKYIVVVPRRKIGTAYILSFFTVMYMMRQIYIAN